MKEINSKTLMKIIAWHLILEFKAHFTAHNICPLNTFKQTITKT